MSRGKISKIQLFYSNVKAIPPQILPFLFFPPLICSFTFLAPFCFFNTGVQVGSGIRFSQEFFQLTLEFFVFFSGLFEWITLFWGWFERPLPLAQVIVTVFHDCLKLTISQVVQGMGLMPRWGVWFATANWMNWIMIYKKTNTVRPSNQTHRHSKVKITRIGRLFKPPGHELKHIIWNISVTKSLPAMKSKTKQTSKITQSCFSTNQKCKRNASFCMNKKTNYCTWGARHNTASAKAHKNA